MSSENALLLRSSSTGRGSPRRSPLPSSPSLRRRNPSSSKLAKLSEPIDNILHKYSSEPLISDSSVVTDDTYQSLLSDGRIHISNDALLSPEHLNSSNTLLQVYPDDSKVVINVTVEGSSGPIRTMVKLGSSVEEAISLVIEEYTKQGRIPPLNKETASQYELHLSSFDLESLNRSSLIGNLGSRTFYLRKHARVDESRAWSSEITCADEVIVAHGQQQPCPLMVFLPAYISGKIAKILRRMCELWKMLGCLQYDS